MSAQTYAHVPTLSQRWVADHLRSMLAWSAGAAAVALLYLPLYPSMRDTGLIGDKLDALPPEMLQGFGMDSLTMGTPWGYTHQTVFSMLGLLVLMCLGISQGTKAVAGDEESGSLELTVAHAASRTGTLLARAAAVAGILAFAAGVLMLVVLALNGPSELDLAVVNVVAEVASLYLLVLTFAALAIAVGAFSGRRGATLAITSAAAVLAWFAHTMGEKVAGWVPRLSPFEWAFGRVPLDTGFHWSGLAALAVTIVVLLAVAVVAFNRRDLR